MPIENDHNFEKNEDRATVFLKWKDFIIFVCLAFSEYYFFNQSTFWTHFGTQRLSLVHAVSRRAIHESNILALEYYEQQRRAKTMKDDNHDPYGRRKMGLNQF